MPVPDAEPELQPSTPAGSALLAGLLTATSVSTALVIAPYAASSWTGLLVAATGNVALAAGACAAAFVTSVVLRTRTAPRDLPLAALRCAMVAAWMPALLVFFVGKSPGAALAAALVASGVMGLLREAERASGAVSSGSRDIFTVSLADSGPWFRKLLGFIGASVMLQCATALALAGADVVSVIVAAAAAVALRLIAPAPQPASWHGASHRAAAVFSAAILLAAIALRPYALRGFGTSGEPDGEHAGGRERSAPGSGTRAAGTDVLSPIYPGVILWTEEQRHAVLVPPLPAMGRALFDASDTEPLSIPFFGAYWFYRRPQKEPPPSSIIMRGRADVNGFRSTDRVPLIMEARQNLGRMVDITCCREVRISLANADRWPGTVSLELVLLNTSAPERPAMSLGRQDVNFTASWSAWRRRDPAASVAEVLTYPLPGNPSVSRFDEFVVLFHLAQIRADKSAKIAIERFVLVPAGA